MWGYRPGAQERVGAEENWPKYGTDWTYSREGMGEADRRPADIDRSPFGGAIKTWRHIRGTTKRRALPNVDQCT